MEKSLSTEIHWLEKARIVLTSTDDSWTGLVARVVAGIVLLPHGAQKLLGLFGGGGLASTLQFFTEVLHLPYLMAWMVIIIEFFGAIALIVGFFPRLWAILISFLFFGIMVTEQGQHGFFMNWMGNQQGEGIEYSLLMIALCIIVILTDGGKYRLLTLKQK